MPGAQRVHPTQTRAHTFKRIRRPDRQTANWFARDIKRTFCLLVQDNRQQATSEQCPPFMAGCVASPGQRWILLQWSSSPTTTCDCEGPDSSRLMVGRRMAYSVGLQLQAHHLLLQRTITACLRIRLFAPQKKIQLITRLTDTDRRTSIHYAVDDVWTSGS